ncbi:hypothetical protein [Oceanobacillus senegalensis]|uniref:hypothetical protein n=1 Tax=Oceanobacillus senegalensis TaxID=1936063 RepID=UPI0015C4657C|nr:hypothetical protein [Oceanobacillus senegalensis]
MGLMNNGRGNLVITNHVLRYSYYKSNKLDGLVDYVEVGIPSRYNECAIIRK